jgi:hypothetical protein
MNRFMKMLESTSSGQKRLKIDALPGQRNTFLFAFLIKKIFVDCALRPVFSHFMTPLAKQFFSSDQIFHLNINFS